MLGKQTLPGWRAHHSRGTKTTRSDDCLPNIMWARLWEGLGQRRWTCRQHLCFHLL